MVLTLFLRVQPRLSAARGRSRAVSKSPRAETCIISLSRWHIYCACQRGRASVLGNVVEYEKGNYISLGDLLTAMTTSYLYIIIIGDDFQVLQPPRAAFNSHHIWARLSPAPETLTPENGEKQKRKVIAMVSSSQVVLIKTQQIRCRPVCIHYQFLHAPALALNIRQPPMPA